MEESKNACSGAPCEGGSEHIENRAVGVETPKRGFVLDGQSEGAVLAALACLTRKVEDLEEEVRTARERPAPSPDVEPMWTRQNVADYLQCSLRFVDSLIADNVLVGVQVGGLKRFDRRAVEAVVKGSSNRRLQRVCAKGGAKRKAA